MHLMAYIHYWLLNTQRRLNSFPLFHIFLSHCLLSFYLFSNSYAQRNITSVIVYFESFCHVIYYTVSEIWIAGHLFEDCFYCYSQKIKLAVSNESLIPYKLTKRETYFFWVENCYLLTWNLAHVLSKNFLNVTWCFLLKSSYFKIFSS